MLYRVLDSVLENGLVRGDWDVNLAYIISLMYVTVKCPSGEGEFA